MCWVHEQTIAQSQLGVNATNCRRLEMVSI